MPHTINSAYDLAFELEVLRELLSSRQRRFSHYSELDAVQATEAWQKERLIGTTTPALLTLECLQEVRNDFVKAHQQAAADNLRQRPRRVCPPWYLDACVDVTIAHRKGSYTRSDAATRQLIHVCLHLLEICHRIIELLVEPLNFCP
ncbi:hypothetical protein V8C86DRAFT_3024446 [Haematococcus lacustris]